MSNKYEYLGNNLIDISHAVYPGTDTLFFGDYANRLQTDEGLCFGLVFMWGRAVLLGEEHLYFERLDILTRNFEINPFIFFERSWNNLGDLLVKCHIEYSKNQNLLENHTFSLLLSIRAFLDGLTTYHSPEETTLHTSHVLQGMAHQNPRIVSSLLEHNLCLEFCTPFIGTKPLLMDLIASIAHDISKIQKQFFISINNVNHTIGAVFSQTECTLFNPNYLHENYYIWSIKSTLNQTMMLNDFTNEIGLAFEIHHNQKFNISIKFWTLNESHTKFDFNHFIGWLLTHYMSHMILQNKNFVNDFVFACVSECNDNPKTLELFLNQLKKENCHLIDPKIILVACENGNTEVLKIFFKYQQKFPFNISKFLNQNYALHRAVESNNIDTLTTLLATNQIDINKVKDGYTPLGIACRMCQDHMILLLVEHGAWVTPNMFSLYVQNCTKKHKTPLSKIVRILNMI